ncbi:MAG: hypothetical protein CVT63_03110 [Candidatus Anoxymicrobium japonicum]|uniref:Uncharacterized protein n=1 Tax=Candidatus Anoxymicrobium japonicum TaxID=2013648 RepID=A0A2N3G6L7_9ACTN|nr:MAG: hypothetical protein CVT63_03110 [Candidatus Anoxymicrobium japonicum]
MTDTTDPGRNIPHLARIRVDRNPALPVAYRTRTAVHLAEAQGLAAAVALVVEVAAQALALQAVFEVAAQALALQAVFEVAAVAAQVHQA